MKAINLFISLLGLAPDHTDVSRQLRNACLASAVKPETRPSAGGALGGWLKADAGLHALPPDQVQPPGTTPVGSKIGRDIPLQQRWCPIRFQTLTPIKTLLEVTARKREAAGGNVLRCRSDAPHATNLLVVHSSPCQTRSPLISCYPISIN